MTCLINEGVTARDVLGSSAQRLNDAVRSAHDFASRVAAAESWFGMMLERCPADDGVGEASRSLLASRGNLRIDRLAEKSALSPRQFQRRFTSQVGLPPKLYARTVRFDHALAAHRSQPATPWTRIIHDAGYYDQAHFVRECHALVGPRRANSSGTGTTSSFCMAEIYKRRPSRRGLLAAG